MSDTPTSHQSDKQNAKVIGKHLPAGFTAEFDGETGGNVKSSASSRKGTNNDDEAESSLKLQGGDIHRDLFMINAAPRKQLHQRSATFSAPSSHVPDWRDDDQPSSSGFENTNLQAPGAFRRHHMQRRSRYSSANIPVTRNFVEFLDLYGSFAGEDLAESDDEDDGDLEETQTETQDDTDTRPSETRPLLGRRRTTRAQAKQGDASLTKTFFTLLKAFVGTGIMFLPKAFRNGGILFSSITLVLVSAISMLAFHLLLQCRAKYGGGYGDLAKSSVGERMRTIVLASITISQIGFVCAGIVFVAENLLAFLEAVVSGPVPLETRALIALQAAILIPLAFIRNISKLGPVALLADAFILIGVGYIYYYDIAALSKHGIEPSVRLFNPNEFTLTIGSAIFTFEGIGLILPIQSSMQKPQHFEKLLGVIMLIITVIFTSVGVLCYATFGEDTQIQIISNFPQDNKLVNAVQFLYSMAVLFGTPVQLFPALRILEGKIFGRSSGKKDAMTKWKKNAFRTLIVAVCLGISIAGASNLDAFVALVGSVACVPLVYIYPPILHYYGVAETRAAKIGDIVFIVIGVAAMFYTAIVTLKTSF
ncbi:hypothetical protein MBLNU457_4967t1 [Dothideomycetes sp. NU457]